MNFKTKKLVCLLFVVVVFASNAVNADPVVEIKPPSSYTARKVLLFPLDIPSYAIRGVTWPIGAIFKLLEEKNAIQKTLDALSNKEKTLWVYPIIEGGAGTGFGGGVGVRHTNFLHRGYLIGASYKNHINMDQQASFSFGKPAAFEIFNRPFSYSFGVDWDRILSEDFYGIGNESSDSMHGSYSFNKIATGATLAYSPLDNFSVAIHTAYESDNTFTKKEGNNAPVQDLFPASTLSGFQRWLNYMDIGIRVAHDTRDSIESTQSGGLRSVAYRRYQCLNESTYSYNNYEIDLRQYLRLPQPKQVLVLRTNWVFQGTMGNDIIPFFRLADLDASAFLRGFPRDRFTDRNSLLFNVEYRYPVWEMFDGVLFYDTGRVFHSIKNISFNKIKYSAGGGINFRIPKLALFHFHAAYGGEGVNILFGASKQL